MQPTILFVQAAQKALVAAQYAEDANCDFADDADGLQCSVDDRELQRLTDDLQLLVQDSTHLVRPSSHRFSKIPRYPINEHTSLEARRITLEIYEKCRQRIYSYAA